MMIKTCAFSLPYVEGQTDYPLPEVSSIDRVLLSMRDGVRLQLACVSYEESKVATGYWWTTVPGSPILLRIGLPKDHNFDFQDIELYERPYR